MATKHLIMNGIGFEPVAFVVTDGLGNYSAVAGVDPLPPAWWRAQYVQQLAQRRRQRRVRARVRVAPAVAAVRMSVDNSIPESEVAFITGL